MPELLLHFSIPFALAKTRFSLRESMVIGLAALLPDIDILLHVHRWATHSIVITSIAFSIPIALAYIYDRRHLKLAIACYLAVLSHIAMDSFQTYTPVLYPIARESMWFRIEGNATISNTITTRIAMEILTNQTEFRRFTTLDAPIFTSEGLIISLMLIIIPILLTMRRSR